jgi:hypothetical protein
MTSSLVNPHNNSYYINTVFLSVNGCKDATFMQFHKIALPGFKNTVF